MQHPTTVNKQYMEDRRLNINDRMKEKSKERWAEMKKQFTFTVSTCFEYEHTTDNVALTILRALQELDGTAQTVASPENEWRPISEFNSDSVDFVIVAYKHIDETIIEGEGYFDSYTNTWRTVDDRKIFNPVAWMYIPKYTPSKSK